jgi:hypothetical protein
VYFESCHSPSRGPSAVGRTQAEHPPHPGRVAEDTAEPSILNPNTGGSGLKQPPQLTHRKLQRRGPVSPALTTASAGLIAPAGITNVDNCQRQLILKVPVGRHQYGRHKGQMAAKEPAKITHSKRPGLANSTRKPTHGCSARP